MKPGTNPRSRFSGLTPPVPTKNRFWISRVLVVIDCAIFMPLSIMGYRFFFKEPSWLGEPP
jgi:hypothetical protein